MKTSAQQARPRQTAPSNPRPSGVALGLPNRIVAKATGAGPKQYGFDRPNSTRFSNLRPHIIPQPDAPFTKLAVAKNFLVRGNIPVRNIGKATHIEKFRF